MNVNVGKSKFVVFPARICVAVVSLLHSKEIELKLHDFKKECQYNMARTGEHSFESFYI